MNQKSYITVAATLLLAGTLMACQKEGDHGHSHDSTMPAPSASVATTPAAPVAPAVSASETANNTAGLRSEEVRLTLKPNQGTEVKMVMGKGQKVDYSWQADGGPVNHDTHGETAGRAAHRYSKGVQVPSDSGALVAEFDGEHGWFWRNRNDRDVTITLKVSGQFQDIKQKK
jgi:hypothetical protein